MTHQKIARIKSPLSGLLRLVLGTRGQKSEYSKYVRIYSSTEGGQCGLGLRGFYPRVVLRSVLVRNTKIGPS